MLISTFKKLWRTSNVNKRTIIPRLGSANYSGVVIEIGSISQTSFGSASFYADVLLSLQQKKLSKTYLSIPRCTEYVTATPEQNDTGVADPPTNINRT